MKQEAKDMFSILAMFVIQSACLHIEVFLGRQLKYIIPMSHYSKYSKVRGQIYSSPTALTLSSLAILHNPVFSQTSKYIYNSKSNMLDLSLLGNA